MVKVLFSESKIDPTGETRSFDRDVATAFLAKIEGGRGRRLGSHLEPQKDGTGIVRERLSPRVTEGAGES